MLLTDELLLHYKRCNRRTFLHFYGDRKDKALEKDFCHKLKQEKIALAQQVVDSYNLPYQQPSMLSEGNNQLLNLARITEDLMSQGVECIYQGVITGEFDGDDQEKITVASSPTLLVKDTSQSSRWGNWSYFAVNTHLGKTAKREYKLISGLHAEILKKKQGIMPQRSEIILRNSPKIHRAILSIWIPRSRELVQQCAAMLKRKIEPEIFISRQRCGLCPWYDSCYQIAQSHQHLSLIPGITPSKQEILHSQGITNFPLLAQTSLSSLKRVFPFDIAEDIYQQAQSLKSGKAVLRNRHFTPIGINKIELYFDIETEPDRNLHYLLGVVLVDRDRNRTEYHSFMAKQLPEEESIWHQFVNFINQYPQAPIFHYSQYEVKIIKYLAHRYHSSSVDLNFLLARLFDLHEFLTDNFFLPVQNYSLKSVANWLDFYWRNPETGTSSSPTIKLSGDQCVFWYAQWLKSQDHSWLEYILTYNQDDCLATYQLKKWLDEYN